MRKEGTLESVDNALRLLLLLGERDRMRVSEVAADLGIAVSSAHRLLSTLRERDFVEQAPDRSYTRGSAFARLAGGPRDPVDLEAVATPFLEQLRDDLQESVHLAVLDKEAMRFVTSVESGQSLRIGSRVGVRLPAHRTSGGKALLAAMAPGELDEWLTTGPGGGLGLSTEQSRALRRQLVGVRRQGFGLNHAESERGIAAIGTAVRDADGRPVGAISVSVPTVRMSATRVREMSATMLRTRADLETVLARAGAA